MTISETFPPKSPCDIQVVIPTKNEEKHIRACLEAVCNQDYPAEVFSITVVDNGSTDNTK